MGRHKILSQLTSPTMSQKSMPLQNQPALMQEGQRNQKSIQHLETQARCGKVLLMRRSRCYWNVWDVTLLLEEIRIWMAAELSTNHSAVNPKSRKDTSNSAWLWKGRRQHPKHYKTQVVLTLQRERRN